MTTLTINLPDHLAQQAESMGLLREDTLISILEEAVRRRREASLFQAADRLAALDIAPMTADEVQAEITAVRTSRGEGSS